MKLAVSEMKEKGLSSRAASRKYRIPYKTLQNKMKGKHDGAVGRPPAISNEEEKMVAEHIKQCGSWGMPLSLLDVRVIIKNYLDEKGTQIPIFVDNCPGPDWAQSFLRRNQDLISLRLCENIKSSRAKVTAETFQE